MVANDNCSACEFQNGLASSRRYDENRLERNRKPLGRRVQHSNGWRGGSEPNLFKHVGLEAREIPAVGEVFSLDFPLYRTSSPPLKKARIPTKPGLVSTRAPSAGSCFIDRPYYAASPQASHRAYVLRQKNDTPKPAPYIPALKNGALRRIW